MSISVFNKILLLLPYSDSILIALAGFQEVFFYLALSFISILLEVHEMAHPSNRSVLAHWSSLVENMEASSQEFYKAVEQAVEKRKIPNIKITRELWSESGVLSAKREYLRVTRGRYLFDICAAPFGTGFFFSSWFAEKVPSLLWAVIGFIVISFVAFFSLFVLVYFGGIVGFALWWVFAIFGLVVLAVLLSQGELYVADYIFVVPFIGPFLERIFRPLTYYRYDTADVFQRMIHAAVLETVDATTNAKGARQLSADERKPVMREFFER